MGYEDQETVLGWSRQDWFLFVGNAISFYLLLLWPAVKTLACLTFGERPVRVGTWSCYWIGAPPVYLLLQCLVALAQAWKPLPIAQVLVSVLLSYNQGSLIRLCALKIIAPKYKQYYKQLNGLPRMIGQNIGKIPLAPIELAFSMATGSERQRGPRQVHTR